MSLTGGATPAVPHSHLHIRGDDHPTTPLQKHFMFETTTQWYFRNSHSVHTPLIWRLSAAFLPVHEGLRIFFSYCYLMQTLFFERSDSSAKPERIQGHREWGPQRPAFLQPKGLFVAHAGNCKSSLITTRPNDSLRKRVTTHTEESDLWQDRGRALTANAALQRNSSQRHLRRHLNTFRIRDEIFWRSFELQ